MAFRRTAGALAMAHALLVLLPNAAATVSATITAAPDINFAAEPTFVPINVAPTSNICDAVGALTCASGECYFNDQGYFACCTDTADCTPITTCIPGGGPTLTRSCAANDRGCTSCPNKGPKDCLTITPPSGPGRQITCADLGQVPKSDATITPAASQSSGTTTASLSNSSPLRTNADNPLMGNANKPDSKESTGPTQTSDEDEPDPTTTGEVKRFGLTARERAAASICSIIGAIFLAISIFCCIRCVRRRNAPDRYVQLPNQHENWHGRRRWMTNLRTRRYRAASGGPPGTATDFEQRPGPWRGAPPKAQRVYAEQTTRVPKLRYRNAAGDAGGAPPGTAAGDIELSTLPASRPTTRPHDEDDTAITPAPEPAFATTASANRPVSPLSGTTDRPGPVKTIASLSEAGSSSDELRQKSSMLLPTAGPCLSAENALGSGYWRAEREQLMADELLKEDAAELLKQEQFVYSKERE